MLSVLISWLVLCIIVALLYWVLSQFAPPQMLKIAMVVCVVIVVLSLVWLLLPLLHIAVR